MRLQLTLALAAPALLSAVHAAERPPHLGLCSACHGERGVATMPDVPHLAGQNLAYLRNAIGQYRSGQRDVAVMRVAVGSVQMAEIDEILRWYAQQQPQDRAAQ